MAGYVLRGEGGLKDEDIVREFMVRTTLLIEERLF